MDPQLVDLLRMLSEGSAQIEPKITKLFSDIESISTQTTPIPPKSLIASEYSSVIAELNSLISQSEHIFSVIGSSSLDHEVKVEKKYPFESLEKVGYGINAGFAAAFPSLTDSRYRNTLVMKLSNIGMNMKEIYEETLLYSQNNEVDPSDLLIPRDFVSSMQYSQSKIRFILFRMLILLSIYGNTNIKDPLPPKKYEELLDTYRMASPLLIVQSQDVICDFDTTFSDIHSSRFPQTIRRFRTDAGFIERIFIAQSSPKDENRRRFSLPLPDTQSNTPGNKPTILLRKIVVAKPNHRTESPRSDVESPSTSQKILI